MAFFVWGIIQVAVLKILTILRHYENCKPGFKFNKQNTHDYNFTHFLTILSCPS